MARTVATPRPRPSRRQAWLAGRCSPPTAGLEACAVGLAPLLVASAGLEACVAGARRPRPARCCCSLPCRPGARGLLDGGAPRRVSGPCPSLHAAGRQEACADRPPPPAAGHPLPAAPRRKRLRPGRLKRPLMSEEYNICFNRFITFLLYQMVHHRTVKRHYHEDNN